MTNESDFYAQYDDLSLGTNYWKIANLVSNFGIIVIYGATFITELLSIIGIAQPLNVSVW